MRESVPKSALSQKIFRFIQGIDERVKLYTGILATSVAFVCVDIRSLILLSFFTIVLGWFCGLRKSLGVTLVIWLVFGPLMWSVNLLPFLGPFIPGSGLFILVVKFTPMFLMIIVVYSTMNVSRFLHTLQRSGLPRGFVIPLGVCIRFAPSLAEEYQHIRNAMKFRGIGVSWGNVMQKPLATIEYILIPLLMRSIRISDELARTALTRGVDNPGLKSSLQLVRFESKDAVATVAFSSVMAWFVYMDHLFCGLNL